MDEAVISQMLRVFDEAIGPVAFSEVEASKRLKTDLKSYVTWNLIPFDSLYLSIAKFSLAGTRGKLLP
jgi:hypothetical protein